MQDVIETLAARDDEHPAKEEKPLTCSLQEAAKIIGLSYDWVLSQSKITNPKDRIPGFKTGKAGFSVVVARIPEWLDRKAGLS